jgi:large subunit ribosomal protein L6
MSRLGKQPITIPEKTDITVTADSISVKGPLGALERPLRSEVKVEVKDGEVTVTPTKNSKLARALWGTYSAHINNMVRGVNKPFEKKLVVEGVGYRAEAQGNKIVLNVGYSHPVELVAPEGVELLVEKNNITVKGINKDDVGEFAANIRATRKPEPYKGKGIRYENEVVRRKQGKKAV